MIKFYHTEQVLSKSTADAFASLRQLEPVNCMWQQTIETEKFCRMFDKFFDCMNTRNLDEGMLKRKPDLNGYFSANDSRLEVC